MKEESFVAQRVVRDALLAEGGVAELEIADRMGKTVRSAYSVHREQLKTKRERQDTTALEKKKKRAATLIMKSCKQKKQ